LYVSRRELPTGSQAERAERINQLKPHIPLDLAVDAVIEVDQLAEEAQLELRK
jgi:hypothetical protein